MRNFLIAALVMLGAVASTAQNPKFRSTVSVVRVDALVTDGRKPVPGLTPSNFEVRDNGVAQRILDVQYESLPLNVICVLDVSGSVAGKPLLQLKDATGAVVDSLAGEDRAALATFSNRLRLHRRLTADRDGLRAAIGAVAASGLTALFDAIFAGLALREADEGRTLLLLFSDGEDTVSWLTASQVLDAAKRSDVVVYPVKAREAIPMEPIRIVPSPHGQLLRTRPMETKSSSDYVFGELADETGGRVMYAEMSTLRETFLATLNEFRQRYVISYEPTGVPAGGWHTIDVKLRGRSGEVKARRGYADFR